MLAVMDSMVRTCNELLCQRFENDVNKIDWPYYIRALHNISLASFPKSYLKGNDMGSPYF